MKNTIKVLGIIVLAVVIGFSMAACKNDGGTGGGDTGGTINGSTITSGAPVDYSAGLPEEARSQTDFNYIRVGSSIVPLSTKIDPPASVTITSGKVDIKLGTPKTASLESITADLPSGVTATPSDAKTFRIYGFYTSADAGAYCLYIQKGEDGQGALVYANKNVTVTGTGTVDGDTLVFNVSLKQGWNYSVYSESGSTTTFTASTTLPDGFKWTVSN